MAREVHTHLMFEGHAQDAMRLYTSLFPDSEILEVQEYAEGEHGDEGSVKVARFTIGGRLFLCIDSPVSHDFTFTPSMSIYVECESEGELDEAFGRLADQGEVLMPLDDYGFSTKFGWLRDRFGVSWQLNLR